MDRSAFKSDLEQYVMHTLPEDTLYEPTKLTLDITLNTIPDFFVPSYGIIVEAKGMFRNRYDELKALAVQAALPITLDGVEYHQYILAVSCSNAQLRRYSEVGGDTAALHLKLPSNTMTGLDLCHWATLHGIISAPVSRENQFHLSKAINRWKNRKQRSVTRTCRYIPTAQ